MATSGAQGPVSETKGLLEVRERPRREGLSVTIWEEDSQGQEDKEEVKVKVIPDVKDLVISDVKDLAIPDVKELVKLDDKNLMITTDDNDNKEISVNGEINKNGVSSCYLEDTGEHDIKTEDETEKETLEDRATSADVTMDDTTDTKGLLTTNL